MHQFYDKVDVRGPDECWLWTGSLQGRGYGCFYFLGKTVLTHRMSYEISNGPIPEGMHVLHSCHNKPCVNPAHLRTGTNQENMDDMVEAGRQNKPRGEDHGFAKLTEADVLEIRNLLTTDMRQWQIAEMFYVRQQAISKINLGLRWSHIK